MSLLETAAYSPTPCPTKCLSWLMLGARQVWAWSAPVWEEWLVTELQTFLGALAWSTVSLYALCEKVTALRAGDAAQLVEFLLSVHKARGLSLSNSGSGCGGSVWDSRIQKMESSGSEDYIVSSRLALPIWDLTKRRTGAGGGGGIHLLSHLLGNGVQPSSPGQPEQHRPVSNFRRKEIPGLVSYSQKAGKQAFAY